MFCIFFCRFTFPQVFNNIRPLLKPHMSNQKTLSSITVQITIGMFVRVLFNYLISLITTTLNCIISECGSLKCMTCKMLIIDAYFTSNLTKMSYNTRSYDDLTCRSTNVVYGLECHHDLVNRYGISVSQMTTDMFHLS